MDFWKEFLPSFGQITLLVFRAILLLWGLALIVAGIRRHGRWLISIPIGLVLVALAIDPVKGLTLLQDLVKWLLHLPSVE